MTTSMTRVATTGLALSLAIGCSETPEAPQGTYAEAVYKNYEDAAGGKIDFEVGVIDEGALGALVQRPLVEVLGGVSADWIVFQAQGTQLVEVERGPRNAAIDEWTNPPALTDFDTMGYPVAQGTYRLFGVRATLDGVISEHRALEVCWDTLDHCVVVDPVVMQLDGYYQNRQRWVAEGWAPSSVTDDLADEPAPDTAALAKSCKLSGYGTTSKRFSWPAQYAAGFNIFGWKLYENNIGAQEVSIRCYVNSNGACKAAASSVSHSSSCSTFFPGWSCDCDSIDHFAYSGSTARTAAQTRCVDNFGGASINASISGGGASFSVSWTASSGSLYKNGGTYTDTCIWQ